MRMEAEICLKLGESWEEAERGQWQMKASRGKSGECEETEIQGWRCLNVPTGIKRHLEYHAVISELRLWSSRKTPPQLSGLSVNKHLHSVMRWVEDTPADTRGGSGHRHRDVVLRVVVAVWVLANEVETPSTEVAEWHTDSVFLHCCRREHCWSLWLRFKEFRSRSRYMCDWLRRKHHCCRQEILQSGHAACQGVLFWHGSDSRH